MDTKSTPDDCAIHETDFKPNGVAESTPDDCAIHETVFKPNGVAYPFTNTRTVPGTDWSSNNRTTSYVGADNLSANAVHFPNSLPGT